MLPFFRAIMKAIRRQVNTGQYHQASYTLKRLAFSISEICLQRQFKNAILLGGVEQALMAMQKIISFARKDTFRKCTFFATSRGT